jgi:hypothetical protein
MSAEGLTKGNERRILPAMKRIRALIISSRVRESLAPLSADQMSALQFTFSLAK